MNPTATYQEVQKDWRAGRRALAKARKRVCTQDIHNALLVLKKNRTAMLCLENESRKPKSQLPSE